MIPKILTAALLFMTGFYHPSTANISKYDSSEASAATTSAISELQSITDLTEAQWQEDLRFLQKTIHQEYAFLFVKTTKEAFDKKVEALHKDIPNLQAHEIVVRMTSIIASFKYGHTGLFLYQKPMNFHSLPYNLYEFKDEIYIQGLQKKDEKALGAKVVTINGMPIVEALDKVKPVVNAENAQYFKAYGIKYLSCPEVLHAQRITSTLQQEVVLTLQKEGKQFTHSFSVMPEGESVPTHRGYVHQSGDWLDARDQSATPLYLKDLDKVYYSIYLEKEKAMYIRHSRIADEVEESTKDFYSRVLKEVEEKEADKLIIDLRLNGGGNNYLNKDVIKRIIQTERINATGKLFVIIGKRTFSACQNLVNELDNYTNVIFVGEPTAENINFWGDNRPVKLPNTAITVSLSYLWWQDKPSLENAEWIAPSVPVRISFEEYINNEDPVLQAALNFDIPGFRPKPLDYIVSLYLSGQTEKMGAELSKMMQDTNYAFYDFEAGLIGLGNLLLQSKRDPQVQAAIQVFTMITQVFPDSAKAYNYLGESYAAAGDIPGAKEAFKKAIQIDNQGNDGQSAKVKLTQLMK